MSTLRYLPVIRTACAIAAMSIVFVSAATASAQLWTGFMIEVTVDEARIMDGSNLVATVPRGTRLWAQKKRPDWFFVKAPDSTDVGWLYERIAKHRELFGVAQPFYWAAFTVTGH